MSEKISDLNVNFAENPHFTDTGSAKNSNFIQKQEKPVQQNISFSDENANKVVNTEENAVKSETFPSNNATTGEHKSFSVENSINQHVSPPNSALQCENTSKDVDLFDEENVRAFSNDFPGVDINKLRESKNFQDFLGVLNKNPTLSQVYACFNSIVAFAEENSQKKLAQAMANAKSSPGALSSSQECAPQYFTKEQVLKMTPAQIKAHFSQIRKSQEKW